MGRVVAFEPNPAARAVLKRHIQMNALNERVTIVPTAVGGCCGEAILFASRADGMSRLAEPNQAIADRTSPITVPLTTLDAYCEEKELLPDWLFMDIEGFEIAALTGATGMIKRKGGSLNMIVEMHPNLWSSAGTSRAQAERLLFDLHLRVQALTEQGDPLGKLRIGAHCAHLSARSSGEAQQGR